MNNERATQSIPFPDEIVHLSDITCKLEEVLKKSEADVYRINNEYRDAKRYMAEYRGEIDPHEMFQNELLLKQTDRTGAFAVSIYNKIAKLKESPYFARIDFQSKDSREPAKFYIGRFAFSYKNEFLIFDWRAPIASIFYDYGIGPAGYDAPLGRIDGVLTRKRQYKIKNGVMEYALESSVHVQDDILQKELSHTSDEKMKTIITTIQKEQNQIIRNEKTKTLIIQGVAGSGKTSIALHRIAFLLYRFRNKLSAQNVMILSPNKVFGDYISNVIPELGEEPICELSFSDIAEILLDGVVKFEADKDPLEVQDDKWIERVRFKSTLKFVGLLDDYIASLSERIFKPLNYTFDHFTASSEWIQNRFRAYEKYPIKQKLTMVADDIYQRFQTDNINGDELPRPRAILKSLTSMLTMKNTIALYKDFYLSIEKPQLFVMPDRKTIEWADVFPFLYLHTAFEGMKEIGRIKHLLIDEMQDYTPIQFTVINRLFPCSKTILGDFGQFLNPYHSQTLADIRRLYEDAEFLELNKSYRSTYEIMAFAKRIQHITSLEAMERHGVEPVSISCINELDEVQKIKRAICSFEKRGNASLGIILKTNKAAQALYNQISGEFDVNLISIESTSFAGGVSVTSIQMAKGLEFDEVIVPQVTIQNYTSNFDRSLLYIACTRAMHLLTLFYTGEPSNLIQ